MFRKLFFFMMIFIFTTGFLKSDLEKCANYWFEKQPNSTLFPTAVYDKVERSEEEIKKRREEREILRKKEIKRYRSLPFCKGKFTLIGKPDCQAKNNSSGLSYEDMLRKLDNIDNRLDKYKRVKIRDIPQKDIKMLRKKFLNKNLKKKLNLGDTNNIETMASKKYNQLYTSCIDEKKNNLELFKAKY
ncbi:hypothetical protein N9U36_02960 [Candidatus Pelagibacter sp.]|nr:hypothetical protein [Candidatus Pelagibacter sp.]